MFPKLSLKTLEKLKVSLDNWTKSSIKMSKPKSKNAKTGTDGINGHLKYYILIWKLSVKRYYTYYNVFLTTSI
jgi:hypothetical protein